ncbi:MAG: hypothetical protein HGA49_07545 [Eubacteriaceae bacterium]|nr:hypothetical protein [Eubacteriaceae bacterium]
MSKDMNSEYYLSFPDAVEKYSIDPEAIPFAAENFQSVEEMFFAFTMFLIS